MALDISFGKSRSDTNWKSEFLEWEEFVDLLVRVRRTSETMDAYDRMDSFSKGRVKDGRAFVGGLVKSGRRKKENVQSRCLITLDADCASLDFISDVEFTIGGIAYAIYSTHSHRDNSPRYRLIIPLSREVGVDEYAAISRIIAQDIGLDNFDKTTFEPHRLMYLPSCSKDATPVFVVGEGDILDPDGVLARYDDWTDINSWPRHVGTNNVSVKIKKAQCPFDKHGIIGLFCRAFGIVDVIEAFLSEVYIKGSIPNRYTFVGGTSANGLEIYPTEGFAFSHQDSDPISDGHVYNAFDIVRVHKFGHLDSEIVPSSKQIPPSVTAMEVWASKLDAVKKLMVDEKNADLGDFDIDEEDWQSMLDLHSKSGDVLPTAKNVEIILSHGDFKGVLAYDEFGNLEVIRSDLPWRSRERPRVEYEAWASSDDARMRHYFNKMYSIRGAGIIMDAFKEVSRRNSFHPIRDFIESVEWDKVPRVDNLFIDYLGAEDCHYVRRVTRKMLLAAVTRIYEPGTKFDEMLVIIGPQGAGKSSLLAKIGGRWFSDSLRNFDNKEAGEHLQNGWIFEISELSAMKKSELEDVKAFLSKTEDRYRVAYDRSVSDFPRKCVFFGTTNDKEFLKDMTGNRRFWPVEVDPKRAKVSHWTHLSSEDVRQIWAEVLMYYRQGESLQLDDEVKAEVVQRQEYHLGEDERTGIIRRWLDSEVESVDGSKSVRDCVCAIQVWIECLGGDRRSATPWEMKFIRDVLRTTNGWEEQEKKKKFGDYGIQRVFVRQKLV